jgi:photosystem II stability/assembly factor-like uncharacterized protein
MIRLIWQWVCVAGIFGVLFCGNQVFAQQWERLPLNAGHLDKLVQNPYDEKEIVGYIRKGDFFRSTDGGLSWSRIIQDSVTYTRAYLDLTFDKLGRIYLITAGDGVYRSNDKCFTWDSLLVLGRGRFGGTSCVRMSNNNSIFVWESNTPSLFQSGDDGATWIEIGPQILQYDWDLFVDTNHDSLIVILSMNEAVVTLDRGSSWLKYTLPAPAISRLYPRFRDGILTFYYCSGSDYSQIFVSCDTGKTWLPSTSQAIRVIQGDCMTSTLTSEKFLQRTESNEYLLLCHTLHRSIDSGRTFHQVTDFRVEDIVQIGTDLIASVPIRGLVRSTDFGDSWHSVPSPPMLFNLAHVEFAHAQGDTMFALLYGEEFNGTTGRRFVESDDGGISWRSLFFSYKTYNLFVDIGRPARYYLHSQVPDDRYGDPQNRYSLLTGLAGQTEPDTVLVTTSIPKLTDRYPSLTFQCTPSERFPGWLYASRHTNSIGWSSDWGTTWQWAGLGISISKVTPWPSQCDPLRIVVDAYEADPLVVHPAAGLYYTSDGGATFSWINRNENLGNFGAGKMFTTSKDRYFLDWPPDSTSTDYGSTWTRLREGIDHSVTEMRNFQSHGRVIMETDVGMYVFNDERWILLRDREGNSVWPTWMRKLRSREIAIDLTDEYLYVLLPMHGLYRIGVKGVTGLGDLADTAAETPSLRAFPNPATDRVTMTWGGFEQTTGATLSVYDALGRRLRNYPVSEDSITTSWDCRNSDGASVPPGFYIARLATGTRMFSTKILISR